EETMDIDCETVAEASTQGTYRRAVALISYSNIDSIFNQLLHGQETQSLDGKPRRVRLNSRVISGAVGDGRPANLSRAVNFTLRHRQKKKSKEEAFCVHWKYESGKGTWTQKGCKVLRTDGTQTTCSCNQMSSFAILMASTAIEEDYLLTVITYVGLSLSLVCLLLAILTFLLCRPIQNVTTSIHLQLCLCLFLADLIFLFRPQVACAIIAGLLHFLYLACFTWMLLEGLHLFLMARNLKVVNYSSASRFKQRYMCPFGYGFPALLVVISAIVNPGGYGTDHHCWLSPERGFVWSFLGPVCAIILVAPSLCVGVFVTVSLRLPLSRLLTFKAIAQLFILGCTWIIGLFQFGPLATVMAYLFTIVNSLQGVVIFLVHCLLNRQVPSRPFCPVHRRQLPTTGLENKTGDAHMGKTSQTLCTQCWGLN
uniref:Uncharacterized protein n=1 Tax=Sphenodon punctatus TaxID=8508 RepID=A0A8D0L5H7_SPHPU